MIVLHFDLQPQFKYMNYFIHVYTSHHKNYYAKNREKILARQNDIIPRTLRFSNHVVKAGMETTRKGTQAAREPNVNRTRKSSEITEGSTVKTAGNGSTNIRGGEW